VHIGDIAIRKKYLEQHLLERRYFAVITGAINPVDVQRL
jgi:hypothetical protein